MTELPRWVYDVVIAIDQYEDEHPSAIQAPVLRTDGKPAFISGHKDSPDFGGWEWCIERIRRLIPGEVLDTARAIARYNAREV